MLHAEPNADEEVIAETGENQVNLRALRSFVGGSAWPLYVVFGGSWFFYLFLQVAFAHNVINHWVLVIGATVAVFVVFTPLHEAVHGNIESRQKSGLVTLFIGYMSGILFIAPFKAFQAMHLTHHQNTNHPTKDPDFRARGSNPLVVLFRCLTMYVYYVYNYILHVSRPKWEKCFDITLIIACWGFLIFGLFTPWQPLVLWGIIIPAILGTSVQAFLFDWLPHHPHDEQHPLYNTRSFPSRILDVVLVGQNLHLVHHLNPKIPFYRYRKAYFASGLDKLPPRDKKAP